LDYKFSAEFAGERILFANLSIFGEATGV